MGEQDLSSSKYGPYKVLNYPVFTKIFLMQGDSISISTEGTIRFRKFQGLDEYNPNGGTFGNFDKIAGFKDPAPGLTKHCLVCRVGSINYEGGVDRHIIVNEAGFLILFPNEGQGWDNEGGWNVHITHYYPKNEDIKNKIKRLFNSNISDSEYNEAIEFIKKNIPQL
jgi:hypothetical protein